jgi:hypothetical protein
MLDSKLHHLRNGTMPEWSAFPEQPEGPRLVVSFQANTNDVEHSLRIRQQDVKQAWRVLLNEQELGKLTVDENDMLVHFVVPPGGITNGANMPIAKPYQPTSPVVERRVIGSTSAVWIDSDGDGQRTSARAYAQRLMTHYDNRPSDVAAALAPYDEAVAVQAGALLKASGANLLDAELRAAVKQAGPHVERGFRAFLNAWRACEVARDQ